jgi:hypothetical protein
LLQVAFQAARTSFILFLSSKQQLTVFVSTIESAILRFIKRLQIQPFVAGNNQHRKNTDN